MEQRPLRLGHIVDDYCPRERRLTNHVIVAIVDQTIRQTRCSTCDAEHPYKEAKVPRRKKSDGARGDDALADLAGGQLVSAKSAAPEPAEPEAAAPVQVPAPAAPVTRQPDPAPAVMAAAPPASAPVDNGPAAEPEAGAWSGHRRLIRATLPKVEGEQPPARPIPEFTMHQRPQGRGGHGYRHAQPWHGGNGHARNGNGFRPDRDGNVITPPRPGGGGGGGGRRRHRGRHKPPR
jgi:hypothetical protein